MKTLAKTLLSGVAGVALLSTAAIAQDNESTNILNDVVDSVESTVDSTLDTVDDVTTDLNVTDTLDDVTTDITGGDVTGGDTITDVTGGDTSVGDVGSVSDLIGSIEAGNFDVSEVADVSDVSFVDVSDAFNDFDAATFGDVLSGNSAAISDLQNEISGNDVLSEALANNNIDVSDVVGIENHNDGTVTIYTHQD